jgi:hypothetical protein
MDRDLGHQLVANLPFGRQKPELFALRRVGRIHARTSPGAGAAGAVP